ncbi:radical SAM protein [Helicobacter sp. 16-1353]|uniref:radical SAM protein n=1 Tax=Helicobacter sp. 16-1353 TaxID=2004996 RepID=UPI001C65FAC3|nr:radical SAM protein [Helicobacter sp. 16-1353]
MNILRAKTTDLFQSKLSEKQKQNSALNIKEMEANLTKLESYPRRIVLEMTSACNIKCIFCGRDEAEFNQTYLKLDVLDKLDSVLDYCEEVTLFGWGEPTINPKFKQFLQKLNKKNVRKYFVTNGTRLDKFIDDIFDYKVDIIAVSLDGADAKTNDRIRVGAKFEKIIENIKAIIAKKESLNLSYPYMNFVFVAMESNIRELPKMIKLAKELKMQEVKVVFLSAFSTEMLKESLYNKQDLVKSVFDEVALLADKLNIKLKLPYIQGEDIAGDKYHKPCFVGWRDFFIGSDDSIRPCQSTSLKLGNLSDFDSFELAWNSKEMQDFRKNVNAENGGGEYANSVQTLLPKLTRKLEQKVKLYSNWQCICTRLGEKEKRLIFGILRILRILEILKIPTQNLLKTIFSFISFFIFPLNRRLKPYLQTYLQTHPSPSVEVRYAN